MSESKGPEPVRYVPVTGRGDRDPVASRAPSYLDSGARRRCGFDAKGEMWYILCTLGA
jgi:hypothetical protein